MANNESITIKTGNPSVRIGAAGSPDLAYITITNTSSLIIGPLAGSSNNATSNLIVGYNAGHANTTGKQNVFLGRDAGKTNTTSDANVYIGYQAGQLATGTFNAACGFQAGVALTTGGQNTFFGAIAGATIMTGTQNTCIGDGADCLYENLTNCISIGSNVECEESGQVIIGGSNSTDYFFCADIPGSGNDVHFNASRGAGTDSAGKSFYLAGGKGTGAGTPGSILFQTSTVLGSGVTVQTLSTRLQIDGTGLATFFNDLKLNSLTASTVVYLNASKTFVSLANAAGVLTNNGSGSLSWVSGGAGTVTNIATTSPISGGPITTTGTISLLVNVDFAFTAAQSITINAIGTTSTDGLLITNTTDSTAGVTRQYSPRIRLHGESWDTSGTPQNRTHDIILENQVTTSGTPTGALVVSGSKDGAAYFEIIRFGSHPSFASTPQVSLGSGALKFTDSTQSIVMTLSNSGEISWQQQNSNSGASAQAAIYCGNDSSSTLGKIVTTSTGNSAFAGVSSFNMVTVGAFPIGIVTQNVLRLTISSAGLFTVWDGGNFAFGTTTGTKHGTATSQKQSFWNATPVIQPTTGITGAAFVANSGTAVNDASTFGGYTIKQIAAVLQQVGLMA